MSQSRRIAFALLLLASSAAPGGDRPMEIEMEDAAGGGPRKLSEFRGKALLLVIVGRDSMDAGMNLALGVGEALADRPDIARAVVADLDGVPGFVKGLVRRGIQDSHRSLERRTDELLTRRARPLPPRNRAATLLDWEGAVARGMGVSGSTEKTYQAFVIDPSGRVVLRMTQPRGDETARADTAKAVRALQATTAPPSAR